MTPIILDASVALAFCLEDERGQFPESAISLLETSPLAVPAHWWAEICNGLLMVERRKRITANEHSQCIQLLAGLEPQILPISPPEFDVGVFALASQHHLTIYDACYLYLAMRESYPLLTFDKALKKAGRAEHVNVL